MLYVEFRCHVVFVMLTRSGWEKCNGGQGHVVCGCCNVCMCLVWVWGRGVVYERGLLECVLQVNGCSFFFKFIYLFTTCSITT